ncbi:MAG TPA: TIGR03118 family protein [Candidatus Sulfotelmatobacter sp.]
MKQASLLLGLLLALAIPTGMWAQQAGYSQTNLVSNVAGAKTTDPQLLNPWGIAFAPQQDFWIANNNSGTSTLYDNNGVKNAQLVVTIPGAAHNPNGNCSPGCPTGTVYNGSGSSFGGGTFLFDTEDGLITSWNGSSNNANVAFDNSASGAVYKGLAITGTSLLAANFNSGKVDVYDSNIQPTNLAGSFTNGTATAPPAGFAPHGIHVVNGMVYIAYAMQDGPKHDSVPGAGQGQVDIFDTSGNFVKTLVAAGTGNNLNAPWGITIAPASFGTFAGAVLVGNFGDGTISAFDTTGKFLGQLTNTANPPTALVNPGLWDMVVGGGGASGDPGTLYITAGGNNQPNFPTGGSTTAVFAAIAPAAAANGPDFSLTVSAPGATISPGGTSSLKITAGAVGGFNGQISLTCSAPTGLTCALNPSTISPGSSASSSTLSITVAATAPSGGYGGGAALLLPGLGLFGTVLTTRKRKFLVRKSSLWIGLLGLLLLVSVFALGCGGSNSKTPPQGSQVNVMVTGTSGSLTHTSAVNVTIN